MYKWCPAGAQGWNATCVDVVVELRSVNASTPTGLHDMLLSRIVRNNMHDVIELFELSAEYMEVSINGSELLSTLAGQKHPLD